MTIVSKTSEYELNSFDVVFIANNQTTITYSQFKTLDAALTEFAGNDEIIICGA